MSSYPRLLIDLAKIEHNARVIVDLSKKQGMSVMGVTKACRGDPSVASAMLAGGVDFIADSRLENIKRLRASDIESDLVLLRTPMLSQVDSDKNGAISRGEWSNFHNKMRSGAGGHKQPRSGS